MSEVVDAVDELFADYRESGFVESTWVAEDVNLCVGPHGAEAVSVDVEVAHTHPDVDLRAVSDEETPLEALDGDLGAVGRDVVAALDARAAERVDSIPFSIVVDNDAGVRCASFRTRFEPADG